MIKRRPRILLLVDYRNWAFDICAKGYTKYLSDEFNFTIKYQSEKPLTLLPPFYDLIHVFWWGETYYQHFHWPKRKILKEVSSHRWEYAKKYGPCTPEEFAHKYLSDASTVLCTSKRLFTKVSPFFPHTILAHNGYAPELFSWKRERTGNNLTLCWVGNIKDTVKGISDILIPAAGNEYTIDIATNIKHEDLCDFYNSHDALLVGSEHEGTPLPLIEAMASGCFPICVDVGVVPELVTHKKNGYIVENRSIDNFREAFDWCKNNLPFIRDAGKENCRVMYEKKRWEVCAEGFRTLYREALQ